MEKKDLRVVKTEKLLFSSLLELMKTKSIDEIKVSDICLEAMINRSTFYAHYSDKYELLVAFIDYMKSSITEALEKNDNIINTKEYYLEMIELLLEFMEDKRDVYYSILINNRSSIATDIIVDAINNDIKNRIQEEGNEKNDVPSEIVSVFYLGAVAGVVIEWLRNSHKYTKQDVIDYLNILIPDMLLGANRER